MLRGRVWGPACVRAARVPHTNNTHKARPKRERRTQTQAQERQTRVPREESLFSTRSVLIVLLKSNSIRSNVYVDVYSCKESPFLHQRRSVQATLARLAMRAYCMCMPHAQKRIAHPGQSSDTHSMAATHRRHRARSRLSFAPCYRAICISRRWRRGLKLSGPSTP